MKRCPECRRDYYDDTLLYCLDDGNALLEGPASMDEPATAILSEPPTLAGGQSASENPTRPFIHTTAAEAEPQKPLGDSSEGQSLSAHRAAKPLAVLVAAVLVLVGGFFSYRYFRIDSSEQISSIAVLPFENRGGNPDSDYLSDGLAESLIYRLSQVPELKVSPRSSVFRYKGQTTDAEKIGTELGVDTVMSGRVVQRGDNLTISVDLVDVRNRKTIWGEQFERKMSDLLVTQREIASSIAEKLKLNLSGSTQKGITKNYTDSNDAYQHYLQGRFYWNKRTPDSNPKAIEQFKAAVQKDPNFALAYSGLADAYILSQYLTRRWEGGYGLSEASENAKRAIRLDPTLAEPHAALGLINQDLWDWDEAENEFKLAIELNPNYATAHHWYSRFLRTVGRYDEAMAEIRKAQEADPLSLVIAENMSQNLLEKGDADAAIEQCKRTIDLDPRFWVIRLRLAAAYLEKGQKEEGLAEAAKAFELVNRATTGMGFFGYAQGIAGNRDEALATAKELEKRFTAGEGDGVRIASVYVGLGDKDKAFEWLEKDFQAKRPSLVEIFLEHEFKSLRGDPRYKDLTRRMGLRQ
jgi:TolB-like protein/Tfp pilus assembly protein PilF